MNGLITNQCGYTTDAAFYEGRNIRPEMSEPEDYFFPDGYEKSDLVNDIEYLCKAGLIDIVGINNEGEWLYGLSEMARAAVDASNASEPYSVLSELLREAREREV